MNKIDYLIRSTSVNCSIIIKTLVEVPRRDLTSIYQETRSMREVYRIIEREIKV